MNSMLTAMRSGISAVGRRMGVSLPQTLRKMLEGTLGLPGLLPASLPLNAACPMQHCQWHLHEMLAEQANLNLYLCEVFASADYVSIAASLYSYMDVQDTHPAQTDHA